MKCIVLTGGGSAGHVTPHLALLPKLADLQWDIHYIGTKNGIERDLMTGLVPYHAISAGKLRRYFDLKNFSDPFRVLQGTVEAFWILRRLRPNVILSKGGFVSLPVAVAARSLGIPVILHESDITPGLANRLALPFATHLCVTFPETLQYIKKASVSLTGNPIRESLFTGEAKQGYALCKFQKGKPLLLVIGGSLGASKVNQALRESLVTLTKSYQIAHICGEGNVDTSIEMQGYTQFSYVNDELRHLFAAADMVISRAGANAIFELLALRKPNLLIPLSRSASRGDQIMNAKSFVTQGFSILLAEEKLTPESLVENIHSLAEQASKMRKTMELSPISKSSDEVMKVILEYVE